MQPAAHFVNMLGLKMIRVGAAAFDAWTPSFADAESASVEVSGRLERPPLPHRVELPGEFCLAQVPVTLLAVYVDEIFTRGEERKGYVSALPITVRKKG